MRRARGEIEELAGADLGWVAFASATAEVLRRVIPFERMCWHPVDPGTLLFTGSFTENVVCSAAWLAEHEYVLDDVNKWAFLARSGYRAGSLNHATHGDLSLSARFRSSESFGQAFADELRASFVEEGTYWGSAGFIRDPGSACFTEDDVRFLASLSPSIARGFRHAILAAPVVAAEEDDDAPGLIVFDEQGEMSSISPIAERWLEELVEVPARPHPSGSHVLQVLAATARASVEGGTTMGFARARVQTRSGRWLLLYGTSLSGSLEKCIGVIIRPASPHEVGALLLDAYGLSHREQEVTRLCLKGSGTKEIARLMNISPYTVQDHLKSIFDKTGTRTRGGLVGLVFLREYAPAFDTVQNRPSRTG